MADAGYEALEDLGRVRLSRNLFMRDFLYTETANHYRIRNFPDNVEAAIEVARRLCEDLLEPLQQVFGRVHIRSAFRSETVNQFCFDQGLNCSPNDQARGGHIWDSPDTRGKRGAMVCVVLPWLIDQCADGLDWREFAWWVHDNLPYSSLSFYPTLYAFNIAWSEEPRRIIFSRIDPTGLLPTGDAHSGTKAYADLLQRLKD